MEVPAIGGEIRELTREEEMLMEVERFWWRIDIDQLPRPFYDQLKLIRGQRVPMRAAALTRSISSEFIGAGFVILMMTDCNVMEGLVGLVRQGNGGLLNKYEDRMMNQLKRLEGW
jgi:hypothetical protein